MITLGEIWFGKRPKGAVKQEKVSLRLPTAPPCEKTGKIRWRTRVGAIEHLRRLQEHDPDAVLNVYRCKHGCCDWHVGRDDDRTWR